MNFIRNLSKRAIAVIIAVTVVLSSVMVSFAVVSGTRSSSEFWDGSIATSYAGGTGEKNDPFQIANGSQLKKLVLDTSTEGKYYKLTQDILLNDTSDYNWMDNAKQWDYHDVRFKGHLDGDGHTIDGLYLTTSKSRVGLFSFTGNTNDNPASIEKIVMTNAFVSTTGYGASVLIGQISSATSVSQVYIAESCTAKSTDTTNNQGAAGIAAYGSSQLTIDSCAFLGKVEALANAGGFVGNYWGKNPTITNSFSVTDISPKWTLGGGSANNYSGGVKVEVGTTNISADKMLGAAAKTNMPNLDWEVWKVNEKGSYPLLPFVDAYEVDKKIWSGQVASKFAGGTGSVSDPYLIADGEQLAKMMKENKTGKSYKLINDIHLNDTSNANWKETAKNWVWNEIRFVGTFDGDGHTIEGLYINSNQKNVGLFSYIGDSEIKNIIFKNASVNSTATYGVAIVAGMASTASKFSKIYIDETCEIKAPNAAGVAGIVPYGSVNINIEGCAVLASISGSAKVGAFFGDYWGGNQVITNSFTNQNLKFSGNRAIDSTSANNYGAGTATENGVTLITADKMLGADAKTNMPNLNWKHTWIVGESGKYPTLNFAPFNGDKDTPWTGVIANEYAGGEGTAESPFLIETAEQLAKLVNDSATVGKFYKLTADIIVNDTTAENWKDTAKSWYGHSASKDLPGGGFSGTLDGDGHKIIGVYHNAKACYVGLFAALKGATIKNTVITDSYFKADDYTGDSQSNMEYYTIGAFAGLTNGANNFERCIITDTVSIIGYQVSGFGSRGSGGALSFDNCGNFASMQSTHDKVGAFLYDHWSPDTYTITNSVCLGSFSSKEKITTATNNYATVADEYGTTVLTADQMKGNAAKENMPNLDWKFIWKVGAEGEYPTINFEGYMGEVGETWSGLKAPNYAGGTGTKKDPYLIETPEQLAKLVTDYATAGKYYKLTADIIINDTSVDNWQDTAKPWFTYSNFKDTLATLYFEGSLDGNAHSISGLYYNGTNFYVGLFSRVKNASIKNLELKDSVLITTSTSTGAGVAALGGYVAGAVTYNNCLVAETVTLSADHAAGFAAWGSGAVTIDNCASYAKITGKTHGAAFVADVWSATITIRNSVGLTKLSPRRTYTGTNNYSTVEDSNGTTVITADAIKGAGAKTAMPALKWEYIWKVGAEGEYPTLYFKDFNGIKGKAWTGLQAIDYDGGEGTKANPYLISTPEQLAKLVGNINEADGLYYKLTADIYINDVKKKDWQKTALNWFTSDTARLGDFRGHLNGDGHVIYGLYYNIEQTGSVIYAGMFPSLANNGYVEKLGFSQCELTITTTSTSQETYLGALSGQTFIDAVEGVANKDILPTITQCFGDTTVKVNGKYAGGLVGGGPNAPHINNSYFVGTVIGERVAALLGNTWVSSEGAEIYNNYSATDAGDGLVGGRADVNNSASPINYHDNYSNGNGLVAFVSKIGLLMMRGNAAKKNMPTLDFNNIWYALPNGTPVLRVFGKTDKFSNTTTPDPIEVSFVTNGGSACESIYGNPEEPMELPTPTREGYKFAGWYVYKELDVLYPTDTFPYFDTILYAKWTENGIIEDFEEYPDSIYDYGDDYEYYKPGTSGYNAKYVRNGMASIHRIGLKSEEQDFLLNYEEMLEIGKSYKLSFWVTTDKENTKATLSLVHEEFPDVFDNDKGVQEIKVLEGMKDGEWQLVEVTFTAKTKWIAIRTSGDASLYFDDAMILPTDEKVDVPSTNNNDNGNDFNIVPIIIIAAVVVLLLIAGAIVAIIIIKKKKA